MIHRLPACMSVGALSLLRADGAGMMGWVSMQAFHQCTVYLAGTRDEAYFYRLQPLP